MTLLAALLSGAVVFLVTGALLGTPPRLSVAGRRRGRTGAQQQWLVQAGVGLTPRQFWVGSVALGVTAYVVVLGVTATPVVAFVPALAVACIPRLAVQRQRTRRLREVREAWPDGLRELLGSIAAGRSLTQAVAALAVDGPEPLRHAFGRFPLLARMVGVVPALETVKAELADPTSDRILEVLILAHQRGGRIVGELLRDLADATVEDVRTAEEIETEALEQKLNARIVFVLPWLVLLMLTARPGDFRDFYRSPGGLLVTLIGAALSLFGVWLVGRLSRDPVEPRVLVPDLEGPVR